MRQLSNVSELTATDLLAALKAELRQAEVADPEAPLAAYNEHHLHYVLGRHLERLGARRVVLEAYHPAYRQDLCDLYAEFDAGALWLEVKRGWHGYGEGWNNKPKEQLLNWLWDIWKLARIRSRARRAVVLVHYRQSSSEPTTTAGIDVTACARAARLLKSATDPSDVLPDPTPDTAPAIYAEVLKRLSKSFDDSGPIAGSVQRERQVINYRFVAGIF